MTKPSKYSLRADSTDFFSERFGSPPVELQEENLSEKGSVESALRLSKYDKRPCGRGWAVKEYIFNDFSVPEMKVYRSQYATRVHSQFKDCSFRFLDYPEIYFINCYESPLLNSRIGIGLYASLPDTFRLLMQSHLPVID